MFDEIPTTQNSTAIFAKFKEAATHGDTAEAASHFNFAVIYNGLKRPDAIKMAIEATTEIRFHTNMEEDVMVRSALNGPSPLSIEVGKAIKHSMDVKENPALALVKKAPIGPANPYL